MRALWAEAGPTRPCEPTRSPPVPVRWPRSGGIALLKDWRCWEYDGDRMVTAARLLGTTPEPTRCGPTAVGCVSLLREASWSAVFESEKLLLPSPRRHLVRRQVLACPLKDPVGPIRSGPGLREGDVSTLVLRGRLDVEDAENLP